MEENNSTRNWKRMFIWISILVFSMLLIPNLFAANLQIEWDSQTVSPETWTEITLANTYDNPIVVASPEYSVTTNAFGISVWVTNVTSNSFMIRTSDENFGAADSINVHYIVME